MSASKNKVVVTSEQESEARECFAMFDSDNDGFILKKEVPMLFMSLGKNPTQKEINTLMAKHKSRSSSKLLIFRVLSSCPRSSREVTTRVVSPGLFA